VLKLPKPTEFMAGMGNENTFFCQLPDSAFRAHLAPNLSPTILVTKVFFSRLHFFTRGHRKIRLPRNLGNLGNFSYEFIQMKIEFKKF
jgi:hypothetical protein